MAQAKFDIAGGAFGDITAPLSIRYDDASNVTLFVGNPALDHVAVSLSDDDCERLEGMLRERRVEVAA